MSDGWSYCRSTSPCGGSGSGSNFSRACCSSPARICCPHCQKKNSFAVIQERGCNQALRDEVLCARSKKAWHPVVPGPIMAGPFPKQTDSESVAHFHA